MEDRRKITLNTPLHIFTTWGGKEFCFFFNFFSNTNRSYSQFEMEIMCYICCVFPVIIKNLRTVLLFFISFGHDIVHICKSPLVNGKVPSVIFEHFQAVCQLKAIFRLFHCSLSDSSCRQHSCTCLFWPFQQLWYYAASVTLISTFSVHT